MNWWGGGMALIGHPLAPSLVGPSMRMLVINKYIYVF
jgi:hypothetical protein